MAALAAARFRLLVARLLSRAAGFILGGGRCCGLNIARWYVVCFITAAAGGRGLAGGFALAWRLEVAWQRGVFTGGEAVAGAAQNEGAKCCSAKTGQWHGR
jgi:hypothetical protein